MHPSSSWKSELSLGTVIATGVRHGEDWLKFGS
jgi:hypothetical protein